ncbi:MAG: hypothetical protein R2724_32780 [Bryobacterales bacterium]
MGNGHLIRALLFLVGLSSVAVASESPSRMHIAVEFHSDAAPFWAVYVMEARPTAGTDWELRWWRVGPTPDSCSRVDVKALSGRVSARTIESLFKATNPCAAKQKTLSGVYSRNHVAVDMLQHPADFVIVADCPAGERVLELPELPWKRMDKLANQGHVVARLRAMYGDLAAAAGYSEGNPFVDLNESEDYRLQKQGEAIVPELLSGRYDGGLDEDGWARALEGYKGARHRSDLDPEVRVRESGGVELVGPEIEYPALLKMAGIQGPVTLEYTVEAGTGAVRVIEGSGSGHPLALKSAAESLAGWHVKNFEAVGLGPFTANIEYDLEPPGCEE